MGPVGSTWAMGLVGVATATLAALAPAVPAAAASLPAPSLSIYETTAAPSVLYRQGRAAGRAGAEGAVILDFGRPAYQSSTYGTMDFADRFVPLAGVVSAVENYVSGYFAAAPRWTTLEVVVGTNDSCGTGQPCPRTHTRSCGCRWEPPSYYQWGRRFGLAVGQAGYWATDVRARQGFSDQVSVVAGDDAEPGFDPGYRNTYNLLAGYAGLGGSPLMVDFGDAAPGLWSREQLYQVAYGFSPDVPFPEIYYPSQAREWADLARYARVRHGKVMTFVGVLSQDPAGNTPAQAYHQLVSALRRVTGQSRVRWASEIGYA